MCDPLGAEEIVASLMLRLEQDRLKRQSRASSVCGYSDLSVCDMSERSQPTSTSRSSRKIIIQDEILYPWQLENRDPLYRPSAAPTAVNRPVKRSGYLTTNNWLSSLRSSSDEKISPQPTCSMPEDKLRRFHSHDWGACIRLANRKR